MRQRILDGCGSPGSIFTPYTASRDATRSTSTGPGASRLNGRTAAHGVLIWSSTTERQDEAFGEGTMTQELSATLPISREPTHPGELIGEILEEHFRLSVADAAARMG